MQDSKLPPFNIAVAVILVAFIIIGGIGVYFTRNNIKEISDGLPIPQKAKDSNLNSERPEVNGSLYLKTKDGRHIYSQVDNVTVVLYGSSDDQKVVGYDSVFNYDQNILTFNQITSQLDELEVYSKDKGENTLYVGGIQRIDSKNILKFEDTALAELAFRPRKPGHTEISFEFTPRSTVDSNIVMGNSQDALADVQGTEIYIGSTLLLPFGTFTRINQTDVQIGLSNLTDENAEVTVGDGREQRVINVPLDREVQEKEIYEMFGYVFEFGDVTENSIRVYLAVAN